MSSGTAFAVDHVEIDGLVRRERHSRDASDWVKLTDCYLADAKIRTTWFAGTPAEFVAHASDLVRKGGGRASKHVLLPTRIRVHGDRAVVESHGEIHNRDWLGGIEIDTIQYVQFVSKVVRTAQGWRLASFEGIYERDTIQAVIPGAVIPIEATDLSAYRDPYKFLAYRLGIKGLNVPQGDEILALDRPEQVGAFRMALTVWLTS